MAKSYDVVFLFSVTGLVVFSLFNIFGIRQDLFINQLVFFIAGVLVFLLFFKWGTSFLRINSPLMYLVFLVFLFVPFLFGEEIRGSRRWIDFYFFRFQPSEFLKPFFVMYLAHILSQTKKIRGKTLLWSFFIFAVPLFIIFKQPDLGNALVYSAVYLGVLFVVGVPLRYFVSTAVFFLVATPVLWRLLADYQRARIVSFFNPQIDPKGISYNLIQSIIAVGSGGVVGRGLGLGTQSRHAFLPEYHTDFAFASLVEQFGFLGGALVVLLFAIVIYRLLRRVFTKARGSFQFLFLTGVVLMLITEVFINIGMNLGLMPVTGIALPLISYGGSSIVSTMILLGLALSV